MVGPQLAQTPLAQTPVRTEDALRPTSVNRVETYSVRAGDVIRFKQQDPDTRREYDCRIKILEVGEKHIRIEYENPYAGGKARATIKSDGSNVLLPVNAWIRYEGGTATSTDRDGRAERSAGIEIRIQQF